jgi:hypothetical protein
MLRACAFTHSRAPRLAFAKKESNALFTGVQKIGRRFILRSTKTESGTACWHHATQKEEEAKPSKNLQLLHLLQLLQLHHLFSSMM